MEWRERDGVRWLQADLGGARAAFTTRLGGVSAAPFDSLNLGLLTADTEAAVLENRRRLAAALRLAPERIACAHQVHGAALEAHVAANPPSRGSFVTSGGTKEPRTGELGEADGHVIGGPGIAGLVFTADCLPVALAGPGGAAILHCGWRGLAAGIVAAGAEAVGATEAAIGPGIGPCCYEVGSDVVEAFGDLGDGVFTWPAAAAEGEGPPRPRADLPEVARRLLAAAGAGRIESAGLCTSCRPDLFFSHRRDAGRTGRQAGLAWLEPGEG